MSTSPNLAALDAENAAISATRPNHPDWLPEFVPEDQFCEELGITRRHGARLRDQGLPYTRIGKRVFIHRAGAVDFFANRTIGLKKNGRRNRHD